MKDKMFWISENYFYEVQQITLDPPYNEFIITSGRPQRADFILRKEPF